MSDAKYIGGIEEIMTVAAHIQQQGATFSPHNPSGPVSKAVERGKVAISLWPGLGVTLDRALIEKYALTSQSVKRGS